MLGIMTPMLLLADEVIPHNNERACDLNNCSQSD